jgi:hypothetical protein
VNELPSFIAQHFKDAKKVSGLQTYLKINAKKRLIIADQPKKNVDAVALRNGQIIQ